MALDQGKLAEGLRKGMTAEKQKSDARVDRFANAEKAMAGRSEGLRTPVSPPTEKPTFTGESKHPSSKKIETVPIELIDSNPFNARHIYSQERIRELAGHIATDKQKVPALAMLNPDSPGRYVLIDGEYRKRAAKLANIGTLDLMIEPIKTHAELYRLSYMLNEERSPQTTLDNAMAWRELLNSGTVTKEEDIAALTGQSPATVNKTLAALNLPQAIIDRISEEPASFGVSITYELTLLYKATGEDQTAEAIKRVLTDGWGRRDLEDLRKRLEHPKPRKKKDVSRQYKINDAHGHQKGFIKEWDSGKVILEVKMADHKAREALMEELKLRFNIE